jgi:2-hydroxyglutarate dehydrogenase
MLLSGLYYPPDSLKTRLCLRGRHLLYEYCEKNNVPFRKSGKLVVARDGETPYIEKLYAKSLSLEWPKHSADVAGPVLPAKLIGGDEARELEPNLSPSIVAALYSPETGIVDSHTLMETFEKDITDTAAGDLVYSTKVVRVDPYKRSGQTSGSPDIDAAEDGWVVQTVTEGSHESDAILARTLINASGLSAYLIFNALHPESRRIPYYYARGSYATYKGPGATGISHLIYPCPNVGAGRGEHGFQSLGTHLTFDLEGNIRFGPDLEWISPPETTNEEENIDFWMNHLKPDGSRLQDMYDAVRKYLPDVSLEGLQPDYVGIRPKLMGPLDKGFVDFVIRKDFADGQSVPMVSLMGIESPGLTSCLAIAEHVVKDVLYPS